jgi:hypothetical protein
VLVAIALVACHHDAGPKLEAPRPSSTGTPIGYLIDAATELALAPEQLSTLRGLDEQLALTLRPIDAQLAKLDKAKPDEPAPQAVLIGGRHPVSTVGDHRRRSAGQGSNSGMPARLADQRASEVRAAIARALDALDPKQRTAATKILTDHDIDVEGSNGDEPTIEPPEP